MQITRVEVTPIELKLRNPVQMANLAPVGEVTAVFVRMETREGQTAWGCTVAHPEFNGETPADVIRSCRDCADLARDLHPTNIEFSLSELASRVKPGPAAMCAFDLAFHDLLCVAAGMPLYRILGGYRNRIQTSVTIPITSVDDCVGLACARAAHGFRMLKIKGGHDPEEDVRRVKAVRRALPGLTLRLDADGGYTVEDTLAVTRALQGELEMIEQPVPADDLAGLRQVKENSPVPVLADQSVRGPASALHLAAHQIVDGLCVKLVNCGGIRCARQIDAIARAAHLSTMVGCLVEPAMLVSAGLALALSSPNVTYCDLDGHFDLINDPSLAGFGLEDGWLVARDVPGLGYSVNLG